MFVDECRLYVSAGRGGDGAASFHREKYQPRGGPDGGNGGRGGSVILAADGGAGSLRWLRDHPHQRALDGTPGQKNNRTGKEAEDLVLAVPPGTVVRDEEGHILADLAAAGDRYVVAAGGRGGRGNAAFLSARRRAPGFGELGEPGAALTAYLELRLIADVAVVGLPNAGKSTLVGALSAADPKVGAYPFTTLEPTLGRVTAEPAGPDAEEVVFTICDVPGLIEGAHEGKGLGLGFLRHAERALALLHLVDVGTEVAEPVADPLAGYALVRKEITAYSPAMAALPEVVALNKVDLVDAEVLTTVAARFQAAGVPALAISAAEGTGLGDLVAELAAIVSRQREAGVGEGGLELFRTNPRPLAVSRENEGWRLSGSAIERWVAMCDLANPEAISYLQERMERAGVETALTAAGVAPGDEVRISGSTFEWFPSAGAGSRR
ncbi:MAG: GTPase ObgE [Actinomycetota bacterium]